MTWTSKGQDKGGKGIGESEMNLYPSKSKIPKKTFNLFGRLDFFPYNILVGERVGNSGDISVAFSVLARNYIDWIYTQL